VKKSLLKLSFLFPFFQIFLLCSLAFGQAKEMLSKNGFQVLQEKDGRVWVKGKSPVLKGQSLVFVRVIPALDEFEVIAEGQVEKIFENQFILQINLDSMEKFPAKNDYALLLGDPKSFTAIPDKVPPKNPELTVDRPEDPEPGYIEFAYLDNRGNMLSDSPNQANRYKQFNKYTFKGFHFEWFMDFASNYGLSFDSLSGTIPVEDYYRNQLPSDQTQFKFRILYRTKKRPLEKWRNTFFFENLAEEFKTTNDDEYVLPSKSSGMGLGWNFSYEPGQMLLTSAKTKFQFNKVTFGLTYYPVFKATDGLVSRGTAGAGSSRLQYSLAVTEMFYLPFVPWVKRYFVTLGYEVTDSTLAFTGKTISEAGGVYTIPEGQTYGEKSSAVTILIGVQFEDMIGKIFKPRN